MGRTAGFYVPGAVQIVIGSPFGPGGIPVVIPNLPQGVNFPFVMSGRASDEFANADQNTDTVTQEVGLDGEVVYSVTYDRSGTLTITAMKSSFINIALSLAHKALRNPVVPLVFLLPVKFNDPFAVGKTMNARDCVIQRAPPMSFAATEGTNAWTLLAADMDINHGARVF